MNRGVSVVGLAVGLFAACGTFAALADQRGESEYWFGYWWNGWLLGVAGVVGVIGVVLLTVDTVQHVRLRRKGRAASPRPTASISVPGRYDYERGSVFENRYNGALSYSWKNGVLAAWAVPEGQGYRVSDEEGNLIGYARGRRDFVALVNNHFPDVS